MPDMLDAMAIGGLFRWPEARKRADELGGVGVLFRGRVAMDVALEAMGELDGLALDAEEQADAIALLTLAMDHTPTDPGWAVYCLNRLAQERSALLLAPTLAWAGEEIKAGGSVAEAARAVLVAFKAAGIDCG